MSQSSNQNAGDEEAVNVDALLPKSMFVYKYPSNGGRNEPDFSLIWLVGSLLHSQSHNAPQNTLTTIFNKNKKLKMAALKADLRDICENLDKHIPELLDMTAIQGVANQRVNSFSRVYKIGVLMEGLVAVLNLQLKFCKNDAQTSYANFQRRNVPDKTLIMNKPGVSPQQINISNLLGNDYSFPGPGRFDMSFFNMNMDTDMQAGERRCASPRKAGGGEFLLQIEPGLLDSSQAGATSISTTSNERVEKAKKQRKQKRKFADDIIRKLEQHSINLRENQLIDLPADDGFGAMHYENLFDPTSLPPPSIEMEELPGESGHVRPEAEEAVMVDQSCYQDQEISPKRKKVDDGVLKPPPAPTKRNINGLALEPLNTSPDSTKSPRQRRKQQCLRFDDQVNIISKREMMTNVNRKPLTDEEKQELLDSLIVQKVSLQGLPLIQRFGRTIPSSRLSHMVAAIWSNGNVVRTESNDSQLALPLHEGVRQTGLSDPINSTAKSMKSHEKACEEFPPTVDDENPLDNLFPHPGADPIPDGPDVFQSEVDDIIMEPKAQRKTFEDVLGDKPSRLDAARAFMMLLNLQAKRKFMLSQEEPYGQITIEKIHDRA